MIIDKLIIFGSMVLLSSSLVNGCASSTGALRYSDKTQTIKTNSNNEIRFATENSLADVDTVVFPDEDIPEYEDPSDLPEDETKIDLTELLKNLDQKKDNSDDERLGATKKDLMLMEIIRYLNTPYKYGGNSLNGIDCSAFTQSVYKNSWLLNLNRSARDQFQQGLVINDRSDLKFGDLVFFNTRKRVKPGHVGIYIGDNLFAHASSKLGVTISSLEHPYYNKKYMGARRIDEE
jgi:cell wall-associated NlpC family hydrolase